MELKLTLTDEDEKLIEEILKEDSSIRTKEDAVLSIFRLYAPLSGGSKVTKLDSSFERLNDFEDRLKNPESA